MNPFDLHGFAFLAFYLLVGIATIWGLRACIDHPGSADRTNLPSLTDPYLIAHLRAGQNEALRVATVALIDRGLLDANGETLGTRNEEAIELVQRPIEKAILKRYLRPGQAHETFKDAPARSCCSGYEKALADQGLIASNSTYVNRLPWVMAAIGLLVAITTVKIGIAFSQGLHNVGFLLILTVVFCVLAVVAWRKRRTRRGDAALQDLRVLFARLNGRAGALQAGGQTNEAALLAAVFGIAALPALAFPFTRKLYPSGSGSGSACGSSSSSSSSSSCSSSCGGGCGGGGCGG